MDVRSYYTVSEMAQMFDLTRQTLIYYDRIGLIKPASVSEAGYRLYQPTQIPTLRLICLLRDLGMSLAEIGSVVGAHDVRGLLDRLPRHKDELDRRISRLNAQRDFIDQRIAFYEEVAWWQAREGEPCLRHYGQRHVLFESFGVDSVGREVLHTTLARAIHRLQSEKGVGPVRGFGTMLPDLSLEGAGAYVTVPEGVGAEGLDAICLPAGEYACLARWGMPYDLRGLDALLAWMQRQGLVATGDAFDFCLLDTTSYDETHDEDFCCVQVLVR